ncbi:hypothetical protein ACF1BN_13585 [Streptomyces sp. NPDC014861]|uniref:hypothetical protein n=1 Tax=Streptomyces sp. NPDC014861 TaxID=3364923 RepID=UPI0036F96D76
MGRMDGYPYRIEARAGDLTLLWRPGEGDGLDEFAVDDRGRLLVFPDRASLRAYAAHATWTVLWEGEAELDLDAVRAWVERPGTASVPPGSLLNAWHFVEDLARSVGDGTLRSSRGTVIDSAWEKIYGEEPWTAEEAAAVRELLREGLDLWEDAVRGAPGVRA